MTKTISSIFIILYLVALLKPVSPYLEYAINKDFIATVLCINKDKPELKCNGKCHLTKQLKKATETDQNKAGLISIKDYPVGFVNITKVDSPIITTIKLVNNHLNKYSYLISNQLFRPPTF